MGVVQPVSEFCLWSDRLSLIENGENILYGAYSCWRVLLRTKVLARSVLLARARTQKPGPCPTCEAASEEPRHPRAALRYVDGSMSTPLRPLGFCLALNGRRGGPKVRRLRRLPCPTCVSSWQRKWQHGRAPSKRHVRKRWHGGAPSNLLQALMSHSAQSVFRMRWHGGAPSILLQALTIC